MKERIQRLCLAVFTSIVYFIAIIFPCIILVGALAFFWNLVDIKDELRSMVFNLSFVLLAFALSSNWVYALLHKFYCKQLEKGNGCIRCAIFNALISANDVITAIPKRTILFILYLAITVMDKLGISSIDIDLLFVGVVIIGIDRVAKSWATEKKKLFALGKKAYSNTGKIEDSVIEER